MDRLGVLWLMDRYGREGYNGVLTMISTCLSVYIYVYVCVNDMGTETRRETEYMYDSP